MRICKNCNAEFPSWTLIDGVRKSLTQRSYCLDCTPYGKRPVKYKGKHRATDNEVKKAVANSKSYAETLRNLNLTIFGSAYQTLKQRIKLLKLSTDHFTGRAYLKGATHNRAVKIPLSELLVVGSSITSNALKKKLLKEGLLIYECNRCKLVDWLGEKITLQLDHINGDHGDNRIENLRLLCPNCHSLTPTFCRSKNAKVSELADDTVSKTVAP